MRSLVVPALACALLAACSSGGDSSDRAGASASTSPTSSTSPGATSSAAPTATSTATAVPGSGATSAPSTGASRPPAASPAAGVKGTAPGTYTYDAAGSYSLGGAPQKVDGTSTLTVTPLQGKRQSSTRKAEEGGDTQQDLVMETDGVYLARLAIGTPVNKEFRPPRPVLLFPTPATVGKSWTWQATSTDGKSKVVTTNRVVRHETLTIGGQRIATAVLQTHLVISGDVDYTADVTNWVATDYRLPVKDRTQGKGTIGGLPFTTSITSTVRSVRPA